MKFLVDAQLPRRIARVLASMGHESLHTLDLPSGNRTSDEMLREIAAKEDRVLVTKDEDFLNSHVLRGHPPMLLFVTTGNISNADLEALLRKEISVIVATFSIATCIEIDRSGITVHG
jgi:predicted nuclease of predicted toxin-antitoxin system